MDLEHKLSPGQTAAGLLVLLLGAVFGTVVLFGRGQSSAEEERNSNQTSMDGSTSLVCDRFEVVTRVSGQTLQLGVETDLPDHTVLMVSVSRSYQESGDSTSYPCQYFSAKTTIGEWRTPREISIAPKIWRESLMAQQTKMERLGSPFSVASVNQHIDVNMTVPVIQPDPQFGHRNSNLRGAAVATTGSRVVRGEIEIASPFAYPSSSQDPVSARAAKNSYLSDSVSIRSESRRFDDLEKIRELLMLDARAAVQKGLMTKAEFEEYTGKKY